MNKNQNKPINEILNEKILILDGATGTQIQSFNLTADDFGGEAYNGCNEMLNETRPDVVEAIHKRYLEAGADIIETNSFGATPLILAEYDIREKAYQLSKESAKIARRAADEFSTPQKPRFVAGSIGPTTKMINVTGGISLDELKEEYKIQISGLIDGGVDIILFETFADTSNLKAGLIGLQEINNEKNTNIPHMVSVTIEQNGTMLAGQAIDSLYVSIEHSKPLSVGINCGLGPKQVLEHIRTLSQFSGYFTSLHPNAGLPDENGEYTESPEIFSQTIQKIVNDRFVNIIGGCCGTTPAHIKALCDVVQNAVPRIPQRKKGSFVSGLDLLEFTDDNRPVSVGERTNMTGSKKFKKLIRKEKFDEASEIAKAQVMKGAQVIDINLDDTDTDVFFNIKNFYPLALRKIKTPIMIDSSLAPDVFEEALKQLQGKGIINSVNFENMERFDRICQMAAKYGAAVIALLIDQKEMAVTVEQKVAVAKAMFERMTQKHGIPAHDIIFDCLVFPVASGDAAYYLSAKHTIQSIKEIKTLFPETKFSLGVSNCSFGLPAAGREALNSAYLYYATKNGLDMAIVNSEKLVRYGSLSEEEKKLCKEIVFNNTDEVVSKFIDYYSDKKTKATSETEHTKLPLEERLQYYITEGLKMGLIDDLEKARENQAPMDIINTHLMKGMGVVGKRFNANELTVIDVLQSAEVMKTAVDHLKQFMTKEDSLSKGKVMLATVKGDVHDIGKNLVDIVLTNNGYQVVDLGVKIDSQTLIDGFNKHKPDYIGLSGLLVKSAVQMTETAQDLKNAGIHVPLFIGGAALSQKFTANRIQPNYGGNVIYAKDAINGLNLFDSVSSGTYQPPTPNDDTAHKTAVAKPLKEKPQAFVNPVEVLPQPAHFDLKVIDTPPLETVFAHINNQMLFGKHFSLTGGYDNLIQKGDPKALELTEVVDGIKRQAMDHQYIKPTGVYKFFKVRKENEAIIVLGDNLEEIARFNFPRQAKGEKLCLSDYIDGQRIDTMAMFCTTAGHGVAELARKFKDEGQYTLSHVLFSLAVESAEATAELLHKRIREEWGIIDDPALTLRDLFTAKYHGCRYSFGYPACPDLNDQEKIFKLLDITKSIGVKLTDGMMMNPEASVTAFVFHHPEAKYFAV